MVEREVVDILLASISTFLLFVYGQIDDRSLSLNILLIILIITIFLNFGHLILRQLNRLSDQESLYCIYLNLFLFMSAFTLFLILNPVPSSGFWRSIDFPNFYPIMNYTSYLITGILIYIGRDADLIQ